MKNTPTCIIVFGNICSGKTSVCNTLLKTLTGFTYISPDAIRLQHNLDGSTISESKLSEIIISQISNNNNIILECTGSGTFYKHYLRIIATKQMLTYKVFLSCNSMICYQRYQNRANANASLIALDNHYNIKFSIQNIEAKISGLYFDLKIKTENVKPDAAASLILTALGTVKS
jgi:hypothetical protein